MENMNEIDDILDIEIDTEDFKKEEPTQMVFTIRKKLTEAGIEFVTIGKFKCDIYIYLKDLSTKEIILSYLSEHEKSSVLFSKI